MNKESIDETLKPLIFAAIDEVNMMLSEERKLVKSDDTVLLGDSGTLDSLGLINLIVAVEQKIEERLGIAVSLVDEGAVSTDEPLFTVGMLAARISSLLSRKSR